MIEIYCVNNDKTFLVPSATSAKQIIEYAGLEDNHTFLGAYINNKIRNLNYKCYEPKRIEFIDIHSSIGMKIYVSSLIMLMYKAVKDLYPKAEMQVKHSMMSGYYIELQNIDIPQQDLCTSIKKTMKELVKKDIPFETKVYSTQDAVELFSKVGLTSSAELFKSRQKLYVDVDILDGTINALYSEKVPSTSYLKVFDLEVYEKGFILLLPDAEKNYQEPATLHLQPKLFSIFQEHKHWVEILKTPYLPKLNEAVKKGYENQIIQISEALHEKKYAAIADAIYKKKDNVKFVFLAGPSSSGKTTSCKRIAVHLAVLGIKPLMISLDDYFLDREHTPKDEKGNYDFECLEALDLDFFSQQMQELLDGKEIELPKFNFVSGQREKSDKRIQLTDNSILIIEGIHALNPKLSKQINRKNKYLVFVSALTQLALDSQNLISTSDNRLIRRIVRDYNYRGSSAERTLLMWNNVRNGEERHIFPYQENADSIFNSSLLYEIGVLKSYCYPLLAQVPQTSPAYANARRLQNFLDNFTPISSQSIPPTSIMREFLGGSSFSY
ncbi:MAG: nucleoside kinase [Synergistales bacterium]|nr:nucleoside kinase [Bacteroidales bacterium]MDY6435535.1 nucleoside kinase [Synergistales bacterium]MDY6394137.1 nucleoside kinase [Bacteroidales bacterium]MDY6395422.1 nucleoside kinase [Bacteroidales bacterium]MDY6402638.1 nucleoside kinase [Bacteroidales bacterium]